MVIRTMPTEDTIPAKIHSAMGWLYSLAGRKRCDICRGPLAAGHSIELERGVPLGSGDVTVDITLCQTCDNAYWIRDVPDPAENDEWREDLYNGILGVKDE
jgi:hypothetical protein